MRYRDGKKNENARLETLPMVGIQKICVSDVTSDVLRVEITVADKPDPKSASVYVTAALPVTRRGHSLESIEAATVDTLIELLRQAVSAEVKQRMRIVY